MSDRLDPTQEDMFNWFLEHPAISAYARRPLEFFSVSSRRFHLDSRIFDIRARQISCVCPGHALFGLSLWVMCGIARRSHKRSVVSDDLYNPAIA
jgi:hypothetical protein